MVVILTTGVTLVIGNSATTGDNMSVSNVRRIWYEPVPREYKPANVMNQTNPIDWHKPHKMIKGEIHCTSEAYAAFYKNPLVAGGTKAYIVPNGDNPQIPYVVATTKDALGRAWTYTFTGFIAVDDPGDFEVDKEVIRVYPFQAFYCTVTPPSGYPP